MNATSLSGGIRQAAPHRRPLAEPQEPDAPASGVTTETRGGLVWVTGPDGIKQPCSSPRVAALVAASVRNLSAA